MQEKQEHQTQNESFIYSIYFQSLLSHSCRQIHPGVIETIYINANSYVRHYTSVP